MFNLISYEGEKESSSIQGLKIILHQGRNNIMNKKMLIFKAESFY